MAGKGVSQHVRAQALGGECRRPWPSAFSSRAKCWRVRWPFSPKEGNSHFDFASRSACGTQRKILGHGAFGRVVERAPAAPCRPCRARPACADLVAPPTPAMPRVRTRATRWRRPLRADIAGAQRAAAEPAAASRSRYLPARSSRARRHPRSKAPWAACARALVLPEPRPGRRCAFLPRREIVELADRRQATR